MAIGVGQKGKATTSGASSVTTTGVTTTAGSTFVLGVVTRDNAATFVSIGDNKSNTYTIMGTQLSNPSGLGAWSRWYRCENGSGGASHTFTVTVSASQEITLFYIEITGAATSSFDQHAESTDTVSPYTSTATPTTTQGAELLLGFLHGGSPANPASHAVSGSTPAAGSWTIQTEEVDGSTLYTGAFATAIVSATGAYEAGFTETSATDAVVRIATFKETAGTVAQRRFTLLGAGY